jgi:hypothetical protein
MRRTILALFLAGCSAAIPSMYAPPASHLVHGRSPARTGIVVPMYMYPGKIWGAAIAAKLAHPAVPMIFIANVNNGPGKKVDPTYVKFVEKAQRAGIDVLGYVYTSYGKRSQTTVEADMTAWSAFYHTDGIFLDEMAPNDPPYYRAVTAYAHAHTLWFVMGNPGVDAPGNSGPDVINFFGQKGYPSIAFLKKSSHLAYRKKRWSYMAGDVPLDAATVTASTAYVGYLYATDGKEPECYCKLPAYFAQLVALLAQ